MTRPRAQSGSLALETAMALPIVALCAVALLQVIGVARDALLAQELARLGVRIAATSPSDAAVRDAVAGAAGSDVRTEVSVTPSIRGHGTTVEVRVRLDRPGQRISIPASGRAVAHGEPVLGRNGP